MSAELKTVFLKRKRAGPKPVIGAQPGNGSERVEAQAKALLAALKEFEKKKGNYGREA